MSTSVTISGLFLLSVGLLLGCRHGGSESSPGASAQPEKEGPINLNGAGATFPYPLYSKWMSEYNRVHPNVMINYQSIGSGGGIRQITEKTVDFGASDAPMNADEQAKAAGVIHVPTTLGAVVVAVNLPGINELKLTPAAISGLFIGKITKWNDAAIAAANEGVKLPNTAPVVVFRSDGSGTTAVFTDYLGKISPEWKDKVGVGKSVKFPVGLGAKGNEGVTGQIKTTPGAIGYVELAYAVQNQLASASIQNAAGEFVRADIPAVTAAASGAELPDTLFTSITNTPGNGAYPISSYTYLLVYENASDRTKGKAIAEFLWWAIHDGQKLAAPLYYAPLPAPVVQKVEAKLRTLRAGDQAILTNM